MYIERERDVLSNETAPEEFAKCMGLDVWDTFNLPTNIVDFRRFDSSTILNLRDEIPRPIGISWGFSWKV